METKLQRTETGIPRQPRGRATRADIVAVAKRLFSEHGYHSTGLSDIQAATGLTKGAFYHHFRSKEDLALGVLESALCDYEEHLIAPARAQSTPGRRLIAMLDGAMALNARPEWSNCQMVATLCAEVTTSDGRLRDAVHHLQMQRLEAWTGLIKAAQASGEVRPELDPLIWAQWINSTLLGLLLARKLGAACAHPLQVIDQIKAALLCSDAVGAGAPRRRRVTPPSPKE